MSLVILAAYMVLILLGAPIAVALGVTGAISILLLDYPPMVLIERLHSGASLQPLLAVPLFMAMGKVMEAGGLLSRLMDLALVLLGKQNMGISGACVLASMLFAGVSGSAAADVAAVGALFIPAMVARGVTPDRAAALQASAGAMGVIIPPSIPMVIYSAATGVSVGSLFVAGILPGVLMAFVLWSVVHIQGCETAGEACGQTPIPLGEAFLRALWVAPAPILVVGTILLGMTTATEAAALGLLYVILAGVIGTREMSWKDVPRCFRESGMASATVLFIIAASAPITWLLAMDQASTHIAKFLEGVVHSPLLLLLIVNVILLVGGMLLETTACLLLFVPLLLPVVEHLGLAPVQMGVMVVMNLAIGMVTPPIGICLLLSSALAGQPMSAASRRAIPHLIALLLVLALVALWPPLTTWLPSLVFGE